VFVIHLLFSMSMFWGKKKDENKILRDKQINELMVAFPSIRRPNNDDSLFEILFNVGGTFSTLRIYIPHDFPVSRPGMFCPRRH
jgi:hypothetical protein